MKRILFIAFLFATIFSACKQNPNAANEESGLETTERIVCISKQYNEIIYALGAEKNLVGVDLSSTYPNKIKELPTVGYHRALSVEPILSLNPTLIIHNKNIGPKHVVSQLEKLDIPMKVFTSKTATIDQTKSLIHEMGDYFDKQREADSICNVLDEEMKLALENRPIIKNKPKVLIIHYGRASNVYLAVTKNSTAAKMIEWAGGEIAVNGQKRMKLLSPEVIAEADPDIIILTDFGYDRLGSPQQIIELPGLSGTKAAKHNNIFRFEEHDLIYLGPRTGKNVLKLQEIIRNAN